MNINTFAIAIVLLGAYSKDVSGDLLSDLSNIVHTKCYLTSGFLETVAFLRPTVHTVHFMLMTPCGNERVVVDRADRIHSLPGFDIGKNTVILFTGWRTTRSSETINDMAKNYYCRGDYNFLYVDPGLWMMKEYIYASMITEDIGKVVAKGIQQLGIPPQKLHLIGHSLGAHTAAHAGRHFYQLTGKKVARITGLDPARPCFKQPLVFASLDRDDAEFVDVIHSNVGRLGVKQEVGHVDFYPAGLQSIQPGCLYSDACSHSRATEYYMESARHGGEYNFMANKCHNFTELEQMTCNGPATPMGFVADRTVRGIYYLSVNKISPYGRNAKNTATIECECVS